LDRISVVAGSTPETGSNYVLNGSFETALSGPWHVLGNHSNSTINTSVRLDGSGSLQLTNAFGIGGVSSCVYQDLVGVITTNTYTLSFWYLPTVNANKLTVRVGSNFRPEYIVKPILATRGAPNTA